MSIGVRTTAPVGSVFRINTDAGLVDVTVIAAFQLPQLNVELPPLSQFQLTTTNAGIQRFSAAGPGNALSVTLQPSTFNSLAENAANALLFTMGAPG